MLYFCGAVSILLMGMYMCIFSHTFYCCCKPLPLHWALQFCGVFFSFLFFSFFFLLPFFSFLFFIILIFLSLLYFSTFIALFSFPTVLFPLQLTFSVYKSSSLPLSNFAYLFFLSFFPSLSTDLLVLFSLLYSPLGTLL